MRKFKLKLTLSLVSLFISLILCAFSNINKYCLFFGLILLGLSIVFFALHKNDELRAKIKELNEKMDEVEDDDEYIDEYKAKKKEQRKLMISFISCACLLILVAFLVL